MEDRLNRLVCVNAKVKWQLFIFRHGIEEIRIEYVDIDSLREALSTASLPFFNTNLVGIESRSLVSTLIRTRPLIMSFYCH